MLGKQISNVQVYGDQTVSGQKTFTDNIYEQGSLNVKGATKMKGALTVEGAVTLPSSTTFSNPFISGAITLPTNVSIPTTNQLGYSFFGTLTTNTIVSGNTYTIASITLTPGVWLLNSQLVLLHSSGGSTAYSGVISSITTTTAIDLSNVITFRTNTASAQGTYHSQANFRIVGLTAATTYNLVASITTSTAVTVTYANSYLIGTRIA
jgi:hypothetical protein